MRHAKKLRLEAAGWKFGDADDFLSLTPRERLEVEMKAERKRPKRRRVKPQTSASRR